MQHISGSGQLVAESRAALVIDGAAVWNLHASHGVTIDISIPYLAERGIMVTWHELLEAATRDGAAWETLIPRLCAVVQDSYSPELSKVICERLTKIQEEL